MSIQFCTEVWLLVPRVFPLQPVNNGHSSAQHIVRLPPQWHTTWDTSIHCAHLSHHRHVLPMSVGWVCGLALLCGANKRNTPHCFPSVVGTLHINDASSERCLTITDTRDGVFWSPSFVTVTTQSNAWQSTRGWPLQLKRNYLNKGSLIYSVTLKEIPARTITSNHIIRSI